jgi:hypothetical protein
MKKWLSSILVPIFKLIPILLFANGLFWLFYDFHNANMSGILGYFFLCAIWFLVTFRWKIVYSKGNTLYVFNYLKTVEIPFSNIVSVEASSWWGWQPRSIILKLKTSTEFGDEIIFIPKPLGYMATETANQLRQFLISKD